MKRKINLGGEDIKTIEDQQNSPKKVVQESDQSKEKLPTLWGWVAEAWVDPTGQEASRKASGAIPLFAVSVYEDYPSNEEHRFTLLNEIGARIRSRVPNDTASLCVFPGGYFGCNARALYDGEEDLAWPGFDAKLVEARLPHILPSFPSGALLAFGADNEQQQVWVCRQTAEDGFLLNQIIRGQTDLPARKVQVGPLFAAFFVCGEFTGSWTKANGPYFRDQVLDDPVQQLQDCQVLVDVAHSRVKDSVNGVPGPRQVHERQMRRFSRHGAAILTHHHGGVQTAGRARNDCQSNWVVFRGEKWLEDEQVFTVP